MGNRIIKESIRTSKTVNQMTDFQFRLWVYLITYVDDYGRGSADPELLKGFVFPRRKGVTESQIGKTLAELANMGIINLYEVDGESFLCFPNWGSHQRIQNKKSKFPEPKHGEPQNLTVGHGESPPELLSELLSESEIESESETNPRAGMFGEFWSAYPKKVGKGAAEAKFGKINPDRALLDKMLVAIETGKRSRQWQKDNGQFIPNPATWLHQRRWEDEPEKPAATTNNPFLQLLNEGGLGDE